MTEDSNISVLLERFSADAKEKNYHIRWLRCFEQEAEFLSQYAEANGITTYTLDISEVYLRHKFPHIEPNTKSINMSYIERRAFRFVTQLNEFFVFGNVKRGRQWRRYEGVPFQYRNLMTEFSSYCVRVRGTAKHIADAHAGKAKLFLLYLGEKGLQVSDVCKDVIVEYALSVIKKYSKDGSSASFYSLRIFFEFLFETKRCDTNYTSSIPILKSQKHSRLPSVWRYDDVQKILDAVDRHSPLGKRDYAILLLTTKLGIRDGDIRDLKFENIDWDHRKLTFAQNKTKANVSLPLPEDVGWAIIDYLKNGRPPCDENHVFVTHNPPFKKYGDCSRFGHLVRKYAGLSGVDIANHKRGLHSLRHTLATRLLEENTPLPVISEILGHINTSSTEAYLKVDINHLRKCALNPEVFINGIVT